MSLYPPVPEPPAVQTTELDWRDHARHDGWTLVGGQWQHDARAESYGDDEWVYLGDGVWEDAYIASLSTDDRRGVLTRYAATLTETDSAVREEQRNPPPPPAK